MAAPQRVGAVFRACTLNVRGFGEHPDKVAATVAWAAASEFDVVFLQEASTGSATPLAYAAQQLHTDLTWRGWSFYAPGPPKARGCWMLLKHSSHVQDPQQRVVANADGRILRVDLQLAGHPTTLLCVYAPATAAERVGFYSHAGPLAVCLAEVGERLVLLGGDFNCCVEAADYQGNRGGRGRQRAGEAGARALQRLMQAHGLVDVWRHSNGPAAVDVTHVSTHHTAARLDRWLVSEQAVEWVSSVRSLAARPLHTDHSPVTLSLALPLRVQLGKGRPCISSQVYDCPELEQRVTQILQSAADHLGQGPGVRAGTTFYRDLWEDTKRRVHIAAEQWTRDQRAEWLTQQAVWEANAAAAKHGFMAAPDAATAAAAAAVWATAAALPAAEFSRRGRRWVTACGVLDHLYGYSQGAFYAYEKAKPPPSPQFVSSIALPQGGVADLTTLAGTHAALTAFQQRFSAAEPGGQFRARVCDLQARQQLLDTLPARLSPAQAAAAEGPDGSGVLTVQELAAALQCMARGVAPGQDGLTVEFYLHFKQRALVLWQAALEEAFWAHGPAAQQAEAPLAAFLQAIFTMIHKPGKPAEQVTSYRPIALLNVDVRIAARALADRLQMPLEEVLIDISQSAFVAHRDISDNVLMQLAMADYARKHAHDLWLLLLDFASAYDNVDWGYLRDTMRAMGLQEQGHVRWAMVLHRGARGWISLNRWLHGPFPIESGLLQGSGASPLYWCIALQPLSSYLSSLRAQGRLATPQLPQACTAQGPVGIAAVQPSQSHADDTSVVVLRLGVDETVVRDAADLFYRAGGAPTSVPKCQALPVGPRAREQAEAAAAAPAAGAMPVVNMQQPVRYLGVALGPHLPLADRQRAAYSHQPGAIRAAASRWRSLVLNVLERAHVSKQCLASKVVYQLSYTPPTAGQLQPIQQSVRIFVALEPNPAERPPQLILRPSQLTCALPRGEGGLGYPMLRHFAVAMPAKAVIQLAGPATRAWQPLVRDLLADPLTGLSSWVITAPRAVALAPELDMWQLCVNAVADLQLERVVALADQSWWSVMVEPLLYNPPVDAGLLDLLCGGGAQPGVPLEARAWRRVWDVHAALHGRGGAPPQADLQQAALLVRAALPHEWQRQLDIAQPGRPEWEVAAAPQGLRPGAQQIACNTADGALHWVLRNGRMQPWEEDEQRAGVPAGLGWEPAAVVGVRKPLEDMTPEERDAQDLPQELRPPWPRTFWLLGPWRHVWLDPTVHGWRAGTRVVALPDFSVREARMRLLHREYGVEEARRQRAAGGGALGGAYAPGAGAWPRLWGIRPAARQAQQGRVDWDGSGIDRLQASWQASFDAKQRAEAQQQWEDEGGRPVGERDAAFAPQYDAAAQHRAPPRPQPAERQAAQEVRQAAREAAAAQGNAGGVPQPGVRCTALWARVTQWSAAHEGHRMVAWKVLHGALMVGALRSHLVDTLPCAGACCAACRAAGRGEVLETLTHAFMDCPAIAAALDWLLSAFAALAGVQPPRDPLVILADADWRWQAPLPKQRSLWTTFRLTFLGCAWEARMSGSFSAQGVVTAVVEALARGVRRDWSRVESDVRAGAIGLVPTVWFRGRDPTLKEDDFEAMWPPLGGWYRVQGGVQQQQQQQQPPAGRQGQRRAIEVRLSSVWPVPLVAAQAAAAGDGRAAGGNGQQPGAVGGNAGAPGAAGAEQAVER